LGKNSITKLHIAVADVNNTFNESLLANGSDKNVHLTKVKYSEDSLQKHFTKLGFDAYVSIPVLKLDDKTNVIVHTKESLGEVSEAAVQNTMNAIWNKIKMEKLNIDTAKAAQFAKSKIKVTLQNVKDKYSSAKVAGGLGRILGILIYFIILIYGSQVMMSVMEEKTNRIAEVVVSSIKPLQLMLGKIIGVGAVALTQFVLWIAFILIIFNLLKTTGGSNGMGAEVIEGIQRTFSGINVPALIILFILYFIGGFFFYASLYAAIGSSVNEDIRDAQQLSFPVTMLVIFSLAVAQTAALNPNTAIAKWTSIIPISSPFVMMTRVAYGIPTAVSWWEIIASLLVLFGSIIAVAWLSGRIYRVGILMYGKKVTFKEMIKWIKK
jgi:ABC-2 type transport system permease protein